MTAAINASILPIALTHRQLRRATGVAAAGVDRPVMVMRGDGGATDLDRLPARRRRARSTRARPRRWPARCASPRSPTASSSRSAARRPTSPPIRSGHAAAVLRPGRQPRHGAARASTSASSASPAARCCASASGTRATASDPAAPTSPGCPTPASPTPTGSTGRPPSWLAPRPGDPADYLTVACADGTRRRPHEHVRRQRSSASPSRATTPPATAAAAAAAFAIAGAPLRLAGEESPAGCSSPSGSAVVRARAPLPSPSTACSAPALVAVGGGAGGLGRYVADMLGLDASCPTGAEVISSIGDALSLVRAEHERTVDDPRRRRSSRPWSPGRGGGAAARAPPQETIEVRVEEHPERATIRAIATGALELDGDDGRPLADHTSIAAARPSADVSARVVLDHEVRRRGQRARPLRRTDRPAQGRGCRRRDLAATYQRLTRYRGPVTLRPSIVHVTANRVCELSSPDAPTVAQALHVSGGDETYLVGRPT